MEIALFITIIVTAIVLIQYMSNLSAHAKYHQSSLNQTQTELNELREEINELNDLLDKLTGYIERISLTPSEQEEKHFDKLPALASDAFIDVPPNTKFELILDGFGQFYPVEYIHRDIEYRTPDNKDAVAHGKARIDESDEFQDVRILFSRPNSTATLRGLKQEGRVKIA